MNDQHARIDAYIHDLLTAEEAAKFERECETNAALKQALNEAARRLEALRQQPAAEASEELIRQTMDAVKRQGRRMTKWHVAGAALAAMAASVAILGLTEEHFNNLRPTPYNLELLGQTTLLAGSQASMRIRLNNRETGRPVANVPVTIEIGSAASNQWAHLASFTTNEHGTGNPRFQLPDGSEGDRDIRITATPNGKPETLTQTILLRRSWKLMLSTDKPVYQPGQDIRMRSLALRRPDLKPIAGQNVTFTITDPKGTMVFKQQGATSKFGIASADCPLATELIEGAYTIACKVGDTESKTTVEVLKYVLPKFRIDLDLDQTYYAPGAKVSGTARCAYFFGEPVVNGMLQVDAVTTDVQANKFKQFSIRTDRSGEATFEFTLPDTLIGKEQDGGDARFNVVATVTDSAGQTQSRTISRLVSSNPLRVEIIPESGTLVQRLANTVYVFASYPDGRPVARAKVKVSGQEAELMTNELGVASFEVTPVDGEMGVTVSVTDEANLTGRRHATLRVGQSGSDYLVRTDKAVYDGGETIKLIALGGGIEPIFVDFVKDGQSILTQMVEMKDGRGELAFDLPPDLFGTLELHAYRFGRGSLPVRKMRALHVRQAGQVQIAATVNPLENRPGDRATLTIELTDDQGKPKPGAVSLAAVDEAVYSVLSQAPGMEKIFFTLEQQLLKPVYAIYGWSPDLERSDAPQERIRFEQALFALTARDVEGGLTAPQRNLAQPGTQAAPGRDQQPARNVARDVIAAVSPFSLFAESFPLKEERTKEEKAQMLQHVKYAWYGLAAMACVLAYAGLWEFVRPIWIVVALHGLVGAFLLGALSLHLLGTRAQRQFAAGDANFTVVTGTLGGPAPKAAMRDRAMPPPTMAPREAVDHKVGGTEPVRVREFFPETLLWRPELVTDDQGVAKLEFDFVDSITTWRLLASAVTADGQLGGITSTMRVFQPFFVDLNLPVALTRGDEIALPVVVHNYLNQEQNVEIKLDDADWFERLEAADKKLLMEPNEVRSVAFRIRVNKVGLQHLQVTAKGLGEADAIKRQIEVVPDGQRVETVANGNLQEPVRLDLNLPDNAIEGSGKLFVKVYPSSFSQLVEGLDALFRMPYGCFEQTSSVTYPNVLALDYLRSSKKSVPEVEARARQFIQTGYQRLLSFEVSGGGFDWFGRPPANRTLTAYGLMEFQDMAKVIDVDPRLIERTRDWLMRQRQHDGSWNPESHRLHFSDPTRVDGEDMARYTTTAYVAWAVFGGRDDPRSKLTVEYLLTKSAGDIDDPYVLALVANALAAINPHIPELPAFLNKLEALKKSSRPDEATSQGRETSGVWWEQSPRTRTMFFGAGNSGNVETTALAALAMLATDSHPGTVREALHWLVRQKQGDGSWGTTQATILAIKALLSGTGKALGGDKERNVIVNLGEGGERQIAIPADQGEVMKQVDLSGLLKPGLNRLTVTETSGTAAGYQVAFRYHVPTSDGPPKKEPLTVALDYDRTDLAVGDVVAATATVTNHLDAVAPMIILDLPIPAGFAMVTESLNDLVANGWIAKFQVTPRSAIVYLRELKPETPLKLKYRLRATMPVKVTAPGARVYEYYDVDKQGISPATKFVVKG